MWFVLSTLAMAGAPDADADAIASLTQPLSGAFAGPDETTVRDYWSRQAPKAQPIRVVRATLRKGNTRAEAWLAVRQGQPSLLFSDSDEDQVRQVLKVGFDQAMLRKKVLHNIHKSNVLMSSVFWNEILEEVRLDYPEVEVKHMLVDAAATALCLNPGQFDVMVMENMFGDILSDQGGGILGSLGLMPSACMGPEKAYYEPSHGSAPDIAGKNIANPYSMIGSVAMMLEMSFGMMAESQAVWTAMKSVFEAGYSTSDLSNSDSGTKIVSTAEFGDLVMEKLGQLLAE